MLLEGMTAFITGAGRGIGRGWTHTTIRKMIENPAEKDYSPMFGIDFEKTKADRAILEEGLEFNLEDKGIWVDTDRGRVPIVFDPNKYRKADVPILLSDPTKVKRIGFKVTHTLEDIIGDQLNYFMSKENRSLC